MNRLIKLFRKLKTGITKKYSESNLFRISNRYLLFQKNAIITDLTKVKPNLLILGSQKCGTTSLHNYLNKHPDIFMSSPMKEPGYFIYDEWMREHWSSQNLKISNKQELLLSFMLKTYKGE